MESSEEQDGVEETSSDVSETGEPEAGGRDAAEDVTEALKDAEDEMESAPEDDEDAAE